MDEDDQHDLAAYKREIEKLIQQLSDISPEHALIFQHFIIGQTTTDALTYFTDAAVRKKAKQLYAMKNADPLPPGLEEIDDGYLQMRMIKYIAESEAFREKYAAAIRKAPLEAAFPERPTIINTYSPPPRP